jgi:hypothetical protein
MSVSAERHPVSAISEQEGADMKASILIGAITFCIAASPTPSTAQGKFRSWSPPGHLGSIFDSEHLRRPVAISREGEEQEKGHNRCPQRRSANFQTGPSRSG